MISRCLTTHGQRIASLPIGKWKDEVLKLPTECENDDCTTRNCRELCQVWLRMQFRIKKAMDSKSLRGGK